MIEQYIKYVKGELTVAEREALFKALEKDVEAKCEFEAFEKTFVLSTLLSEEEDDAESEHAYSRFEHRRNKKRIGLYVRRISGYVATAAASIVITYGIFFAQSSRHEAHIVAMNEVTVPAGQRALIKLSDSSEVWLNANSKLIYPSVFTADNRSVHLTGEAFFHVKHQAHTPFVVKTEKQEVKVLGTEFNLSAYSGKAVSTALISGSVEITSDLLKQPVLLKPNEMALLKDSTLKVEHISNQDFLLWKDGIYAFDNTTFEEIARKFELYYDITIVFKNKAYKECRFTGKFRQRDGVENALRLLQKSKLFRYNKNDEKNEITIY